MDLRITRSRAASWEPSKPSDLSPNCFRRSVLDSFGSKSAILRLPAPKSRHKNDFVFSIQTSPPFPAIKSAPRKTKVECRGKSLCWLLKIPCMVKYKKQNPLNLCLALPGSTQNFGAKISDGCFQSDRQGHLRCPVQQFLGAGDVGPTLPRIILWQRFENNLAARAGEANDFPRELEHGHFARVADVHRLVRVAQHQPVNAFNQVRAVAKAARLGAVA